MIEAVSHVRPEAALESGHLHDEFVEGVQLWVHRTVEHELADVLWEQLGVGCTDVGPVGIAEVVERLVAVHQCAHELEIVRGRDGVQVGEEFAGVVNARIGEVLGITL